MVMDRAQADQIDREHRENRDKWDERYVRLARHVSEWSKDPTAQVGAVISNSDLARVVGLGFNGFPVNVEDSIERLMDKEQKLSMIIHAEQNAILSAGRDARKGNIYVVGKPVCNYCAALIIQAGIDRVIAVPPASNSDSQWDERGRIALEMFKEAKVRFSNINDAWLK
jgi:dCMP deaminase